MVLVIMILCNSCMRLFKLLKNNKKLLFLTRLKKVQSAGNLHITTLLISTIADFLFQKISYCTAKVTQRNSLKVQVNIGVYQSIKEYWMMDLWYHGLLKTWPTTKRARLSRRIHGSWLLSSALSLLACLLPCSAIGGKKELRKRVQIHTMQLLLRRVND
jgi:hypothetical protein